MSILPLLKDGHHYEDKKIDSSFVHKNDEECIPLDGSIEQDFLDAFVAACSDFPPLTFYCSW